MVSRPLAIALAAGLSSAFVFAQTGNATLNGTKAPSPVAAQAPNRPLSLENRGDIFMARKMYREAIDVFREDKSKNPVIINKIGIAYHQMQQLDNAKKNYEQAVRLKPDYAEAINNLGTVYYARKSFRKAIGYYQRAIKCAPNSASIYLNLGTAYFARKKYDEAMATYQTALKLDPNVFENHGSYGVLLEERSVEERAKFHFHVAKLYAQAGRNDLALQYLRKALEEGFKDKKKLEEDPDFVAIRDLPEFKELLALEPRVL
jgi:tetratricopeptide (TPR) repeat protein